MPQDKYVYVNDRRYEITHAKDGWAVWIDEGWGDYTTVGKASSLEDAIIIAKVHEGGSHQKLTIRDRN